MVLAFQVAQWAVLAVFGFFISDFRRKTGMVPLLDRRAIVAMKLCYPVPVLTYVYIIATLRSLNTLDFVALFLTAGGTLLLALAKTHLGASHAWTGHYRADVPIVTHGVYRWIRHPLYVGIAVVICGSLFTILPHGTPVASTTVVVFVAGILFFLALSARIETKHLEMNRRSEFLRYRQTVHPILPIRPFRESLRSLKAPRCKDLTRCSPSQLESSRRKDQASA